MGSLRRFDYSVLGDTVNLASRLEGVSKIYYVDIIASESVVRKAPQFAWVELDRVRVKGRSEVTTIFGVAGDAEYAQASEFSDWRRANDEMLAAYRSGQVARAHSLAQTLCGSVPSDWCAVYQSMADRLADLVSTKERSDLDTVRVLEKL